MASPFRSRVQPPSEQSQPRQSRRLESSNYKTKAYRDQQFNPRLYVTKFITEQDVILIKQVFDEIDSTGKGILNPSDIKFSLQKCGFNATKETIYDIVAEYDEREAGGIGFPEFMSIMMRRPCQQQSRDDVRKVFRKYDRKNKGYIDIDDLRSVMREVQQQLSEAQLQRILASSTSKTPGRLSPEDFYRLMTSSSFFG